MIDLANTLASVQIGLQRLAARLEETESQRSRYEDLKNSYDEAVNSAKWLRLQNADLEHKVEQHKPELANALSAREAAFTKLKHARKVIRDLLEERGDMSSPRSNDPLTEDEINQVLFDEFHHDVDSESGSSDSGRTVRGQMVLSPSYKGLGSISSRSNFEVGSEGESERPGYYTPKYGSSARSESSRLSSQVVPQQQQNPASTRNSPDTWRIHFRKPPGSSVVLEGPITWERLESSLKLDDEKMNSLHILATSPDTSMGLQIMQIPMGATIACVYDPIFVDTVTKRKSYILDWGRRKTNQNMENYISGHKGVDTIFHTFTFPVKEKNWFYIGAHRWSVVQLTDFWPLEGNSRTKIIKKLCERTQGEVDETEMASRLDSGELKQFCIELTGIDDSRVSQNFSSTVLESRGSPYA